MNLWCIYCGAVHFVRKCVGDTINALTFSTCCSNGWLLDVLQRLPDLLDELIRADVRATASTWRRRERTSWRCIHVKNSRGATSSHWQPNSTARSATTLCAVLCQHNAQQVIAYWLYIDLRHQVVFWPLCSLNSSPGQALFQRRQVSISLQNSICHPTAEEKAAWPRCCQ